MAGAATQRLRAPSDGMAVSALGVSAPVVAPHRRLGPGGSSTGVSAPVSRSVGVSAPEPARAPHETLPGRTLAPVFKG